MNEIMANVALAGLFDVYLPDGAAGTVDSVGESATGTPMVVVTGYTMGSPWTRRVPRRVVEPGRELQRVMREPCKCCCSLSWRQEHTPGTHPGCHYVRRKES